MLAGGRDITSIIVFTPHSTARTCIILANSYYWHNAQTNAMYTCQYWLKLAKILLEA